jgi:hypothetical protein
MLLSQAKSNKALDLSERTVEKHPRQARTPLACAGGGMDGQPGGPRGGVSRRAARQRSVITSNQP